MGKWGYGGKLIASPYGYCGLHRSVSPIPKTGTLSDSGFDLFCYLHFVSSEDIEGHAQVSAADA